MEDNEKQQYLDAINDWEDQKIKYASTREYLYNQQVLYKNMLDEVISAVSNFKTKIAGNQDDCEGVILTQFNEAQLTFSNNTVLSDLTTNLDNMAIDYQRLQAEIEILNVNIRNTYLIMEGM